jgi:hypothetical protein
MREVVGFFVLTFVSLYGQQRPADRNIDFRNFMYPFPTQRFIPVPDKLAWMSLNVKTNVRLVNGRYDFNRAEPSAGPSLSLNRVLYGYLTSGEQLDAVVVLGYHTGGTAFWYYVYAFGLESNSPKLVGWFRAGSRADSGLYHLEVTNRALIVDLFDPERRVAECCSEGFVRTIYDFKNGYFVQSGAQEFGNIEVSGPKRSITR